MATVLAASIDARELALLLPLLHHQAACMKKRLCVGVTVHACNLDACQAQSENVCGRYSIRTSLIHMSSQEAMLHLNSC